MKEHRVIVTYLLLAANVAVFFFLSAHGSTDDAYFMANHGAMLTEEVLGGAWWQLFSSMFLHFGMDHLASNMIVLIAVGIPLEKLIGAIPFALIYLLSGLAGNLLSMALEIRSGDYAVSAGASGAILGLMGAVIYCLIRSKGSVQGLSLPRVILSIALTVYTGFMTSGINNAAHIGGLIFGFALAVLFYHPNTNKSV